MSDERAQTGEKDYWHDKRLVPAHTAPRPAKLSADCSVDAAATPPPPRALRNLWHPIATFVVIVLAIILLSVGLLAATGGAALPVLPVRHRRLRETDGFHAGSARSTVHRGLPSRGTGTLLGSGGE